MLDLAALYRAERPYLLALVRRWGVSAQDQEDCLHDIVLRVEQLASRYDPSRPLRPWVTGVARRVVLERRRARGHLALEAAPEPRSQANPERALQVGRALHRLRRVTGELTPERRAVWLAHDLQDVPAPVLARALSLPVNTVYSRLRLARVDVRSALRRADAEAQHHARSRALAS